jgi:leader peptidase (prepilin peptidase) / N-methyltransferase
MGMGDCKTAVSCGTLLAWFSWQAVLAGTFSALLLAAASGAVLMASRRATLQTRIPFGPALLAGTLLSVLLTAHGS